MILVHIEIVGVIIVVIAAIHLLIKNKSKKLFKPAIIGEILIIVAMLFVGFEEFSLVRNNIEDKGLDLINQMDDDISTCVSNSNYDGSEFIEIIINTGINANFDYGNNLAYDLKIYDQNNNVVYQTEEKNFIIQCVNTKNDANVEEFNLYDYFDEDEMNDLIDFYDKNTDECDLLVKEVRGTYKDSTFIPTEVIFKSQIDNSTYSLGKADDNFTTFKTKNYDLYYFYQKSKAKNYEILNSIMEEDSTSIKDMEVDTGENNFAYMSNGMSYSHYERFDNGYGIAFHIYEDTTTETLRSSSYLIAFFTTFLFVQSICVFALSLFSTYLNKQDELKQTRDTFINAMAHEMKTPTAVIQNSSEMLKGDLVPEKHDHYVDMIYDESVHLNDLLQQMLTYTRTSETSKLIKEDCNVLDMIHETLKHYDLNNLNVKVDINENERINCNKELMLMVFDNFISNAVKYSDKDVMITYKDNKFTIYNSGSTLNEEERKHIFDPLYKADSSRNDNTSSGMGLAITANILKLHNLKYGVNSLNDGVEFYFEK